MDYQQYPSRSPGIEYCTQGFHTGLHTGQVSILQLPFIPGPNRVHEEEACYLSSAVCILLVFPLSLWLSRNLHCMVFICFQPPSCFRSHSSGFTCHPITLSYCTVSNESTDFRGCVQFLLGELEQEKTHFDISLQGPRTIELPLKAVQLWHYDMFSLV